MICKEETPKGVITINKAVLGQLIQESVASWTSTGRLKLGNITTAKATKRGVLIEFSIALAMGTSISDVMNYIVDYLADQIIHSLELPVDDISVYLSEMYTQKGTAVPRAMRMSYSDNEED